MKKIKKLLLFVMALVMLLGVTAVAAGETTPTKGFYLPATTSLTIDPKTANGTDITREATTATINSAVYDVYRDAVRLDVTAGGATSGNQYLVLLLSGNIAAPTVSNTILYIDQKAATGETVSFDVYPNLDSVRGGSDLTLFVIGNDGNVTSDVIHYESGTPPYTLGDVNDDGLIDSQDALCALKIFAKIDNNGIPWTDTQKLAANVFKATPGDSNDPIDSQDALEILKYFAKLITSFENA